MDWNLKWWNMYRNAQRHNSFLRSLWYHASSLESHQSHALSEIKLDTFCGSKGALGINVKTEIISQNSLSKVSPRCLQGVSKVCLCCKIPLRSCWKRTCIFFHAYRGKSPPASLAAVSSSSAKDAICCRMAAPSMQIWSNLYINCQITAVLGKWIQAFLMIKTVVENDFWCCVSDAPMQKWQVYHCSVNETWQSSGLHMFT